MVSVAERFVVVWLLSTVSVSVAGPEPLAADRRAQDALLAASHAHVVVRPIARLPPVTGQEIWRVPTTYRHAVAPGGVVTTIPGSACSGVDVT